MFFRHTLVYCFSNDISNIDKSFLYQILFKKSSENRRLEKVMVEAKKVIISFLTFKHYNRAENEFFRTLDYSEVVRRRNLEERYQGVLRKLDKMQAEIPWRNRDYYYQQFQLDFAKHEFESLHTRLKGDLHIPDTISSLNVYYYLNLMTILNSFLLQKKVTNIIENEEIARALKVTIPEFYLGLSPTLKIDYEIFKLLSKNYPETADIQQLFNLLIENEIKLDADYLRIAYTYLRNICTLVANTFFDDEEIRALLFSLYRDSLGRGLLHFEGKLHQSTFLAVNWIAIITKNINWAHDFMHSYKSDLIGVDNPSEVYHFNLALYHFATGKFEECLDLIPPTFQAADYLLHAKRLEIKTLYELNSDFLPFKLDSFKMFLSRTSPKFLSAQQKQLNIDFVNMVVQLTGTIPGNAKRAERLAHRIQSKKQVFDWRWLLEKALALRQK